MFKENFLFKHNSEEMILQPLNFSTKKFSRKLLIETYSTKKFSRKLLIETYFRGNDFSTIKIYDQKFFMKIFD